MTSVVTVVFVASSRLLAEFETEIATVATGHGRVHVGYVAPVDAVTPKPLQRLRLGDPALTFEAIPPLDKEGRSLEEVLTAWLRDARCEQVYVAGAARGRSSCDALLAAACRLGITVRSLRTGERIDERAPSPRRRRAEWVRGAQSLAARLAWGRAGSESRVEEAAREQERSVQRRVRRESELTAAARRVSVGDGSVIVGPFMSEVGYELSVWIPWLRRVVEDTPSLRGRLTVLSRGGVASWYEGIADRYLDVFDLLDVNEVFALAEASRRSRGGRSENQKKPTPEDALLIDLACERLGLERARVQALHPSLAFGFMKHLLRRRPVLLESLPCSFRPLRNPPPVAGIDLPERFVAFRVYGSPFLPSEEGRQRFVNRLIERVAESVPVVVVEPTHRYDDHINFPIREREGVTVVRATEPATNLAVQTAVVARSAAFVGTFGGMSFLPPMFGIPTLALIDTRGETKRLHWALWVIERASREEGFGSYHTVDVTDADDRCIDEVVVALQARGAFGVRGACGRRSSSARRGARGTAWLRARRRRVPDGVVP